MVVSTVPYNPLATPTIKDITATGITGDANMSVAALCGLAVRPPTGIVFKDVLVQGGAWLCKDSETRAPPPHTTCSSRASLRDCFVVAVFGEVTDTPGGEHASNPHQHSLLARGVSERSIVVAACKCLGSGCKHAPAVHKGPPWGCP